MEDRVEDRPTTIGDDQIIAWTVFESTAAVSTPKILDIICEKKSVAACGKEVTTTMGIDQPAIRTLRCAFKDPTYDTVNKTYDINGRVASWTVIVPIVRSINPGTSNCPPSKQGAPNEPYEIVQYAEITIIEIYPGSAGAGRYAPASTARTMFRFRAAGQTTRSR